MSARPAWQGQDRFGTGQRVGRYEIAGVLGEGAMGIVYHAIDGELNRPVAIKAIRWPALAPLADADTAARHVHNEARAAGRLNHPNIVSVYDVLEAGADRLIVMEYVDGSSLRELTAQGQRIPLDDALSIAMQLLDALAYAHAQGVWHRDIKPANLLLNAQGQLKVSDFGIARIASAPHTLHGSAAGSPGYMAPERYAQAPSDQRADIFACGVILYELFTGIAPFRGSASLVMNQVLHLEPPAPSSLVVDPAPPIHFDAPIMRALAKDPQHRFADAGAFREALRAAAQRTIRPTVNVETLIRLRRSGFTLPAASAVPATTVRAQAWSAETLARLSALLTPLIGPIAPVAVRDAARRCTDAQSLIARLAELGLSPDEANTFSVQASALLPATTSPVDAPATVRAPAAVPLHEALIAPAQRLLSERIGPIAALIVKRAAVRALTTEQFFEALAQAVADPADRMELIARFREIHS